MILACCSATVEFQQDHLMWRTATALFSDLLETYLVGQGGSLKVALLAGCPPELVQRFTAELPTNVVMNRPRPMRLHRPPHRGPGMVGSEVSEGVGVQNPRRAALARTRCERLQAGGLSDPDQGINMRVTGRMMAPGDRNAGSVEGRKKGLSASNAGTSTTRMPDGLESRPTTV